MGDYTVEGPADPRRCRSAATGDLVAAAFVAIVAFPFPVARAMLPSGAFVGAILATIVVAHVLYLALSVRFWNRTPGMYLLGLGLSRSPGAFGVAFVWACAHSVTFWPMLAGAEAGHPSRGLAARLSGLETVAVRPRD